MRAGPTIQRMMLRGYQQVQFKRRFHRDPAGRRGSARPFVCARRAAALRFGGSPRPWDLRRLCCRFGFSGAASAPASAVSASKKALVLSARASPFGAMLWSWMGSGEVPCPSSARIRRTVRRRAARSSASARSRSSTGSEGAERRSGRTRRDEACRDGSAPSRISRELVPREPDWDGRRSDGGTSNRGDCGAVGGPENLLKT
jgi:hypothetical protein